MAITKITKNTPAESLVGKYVLKEAAYYYAAVNKPMKVLAASGKSVEVESAPCWFSTEQERWVAGVGNSMYREPERMPNVQVRSLYMACDTIEEVDSLLAYSRESERRYHDLIRETRVGLAALVTPTP